MIRLLFRNDPLSYMLQPTCFYVGTTIFSRPAWKMQPLLTADSFLSIQSINEKLAPELQCLTVVFK